MSSMWGCVLPSLVDCEFLQGKDGVFLSKESSLEGVKCSVEVGAHKYLLEWTGGV